MLERQPSRTALAAAAHRAAHQILEQGRIFHDPLAIRILGTRGDHLARDAGQDPLAREMRLFIAFRARFAEEALAQAMTTRGVRQLVVLGAGLDTFAYRHPSVDRLKVFEVDHPATQRWKRDQLAAAAIEAPPSLVFVPCDLERQTLGGALSAVGFDVLARTFFMWLGVVPYLSADAIDATLAFVAGLPGGGDLVFDYGEPPDARSPDERQAYDARAARVAALGERWISHFKPEALRLLLRGHGFARIDDTTPSQLAARYFGASVRPSVPHGGGHIVYAAV